jgi:tRNA(Arg) A34 adenosine deaminase TadA
MCHFGRRDVLIGLGAVALPAVTCAPLLAAPAGKERFFIAEAERMRKEAIAAGDQPFGAVIVKAGRIIGYGPSRVVVDRNPDAHAERVAIWDAQRRLARKDLAGAVMYSTSRPCGACEAVAALANLDRMRYGPAAADAGKPQARQLRSRQPRRPARTHMRLSTPSLRMA